MQSQMKDLTERLAAVEAALTAARMEIADLRRRADKNARVRPLVAVATVAVASMLIAPWGFGVTHAESGGSVVTAPFIVRDLDGQTVLRVDAAGGLNQLALLNPQGVGVTALVADHLGGMLIAAGPDGQTRASLGLTEFGDGGLALWDVDRKPIADLLKGPNGGRGLGIYDSDGKNKIEVATQPANNAAMVRVKSADQPHAALLFVDNNNSGLFVKDPVTGSLIAGVGLDSPDPGPDGALVPARSGLTVFSTDGKPVVEAYQNPGGHGSLIVRHKSDPKLGAVVGVSDEGPALVMYTTGGAQRAELAVLNGKPTLEMQNGANAQIVQITEGMYGGGRLQLGNSTNNTVVEAGVLENGHGLVRAYPWQASTPGMFLGLPGTYIVGHERGGGQ